MKISKILLDGTGWRYSNDNEILYVPDENHLNRGIFLQRTGENKLLKFYEKYVKQVEYVLDEDDNENIESMKDNNYEANVLETIITLVKSGVHLKYITKNGDGLYNIGVDNFGKEERYTIEKSNTTKDAMSYDP